MALQRIIRRSMDTSSVGVANLAELRDGTYLQNKLARLDDRYEKATKLLSYVTTNVDVLGVIFRGVLPSGFMSRLFVEARDFSVVTDDPNEPPKLKVETGDFGKCQYSAQSITLSGTVWQFLKRTQDSANDVLRTQQDPASDGVSIPSNAPSEPSDAGEEGSIWDEYLESPFFSLRFHFFASCQVSRDHVFLSIGSASLTEPKVAQIKHRVCLGQLLQDLDMLSVVDSNASRRKTGARFQHALHQRAADAERHGPSSFSNYSQRQTLFSQSSFTSVDDFDGTSEPASVYESEAHDSATRTPRQFFQREDVDSSAVSSDATASDALPPRIQPNVRSVDRQKSALYF
ncbi:uncharacterized protein IUM83_16196 [Phytophthora cinnamomi]|nr:hypothetical protein IUM83_16196 [Phytophthora cinnamomi]